MTNQTPPETVSLRMIETTYPHRIEADPETCPVCCGDRATDDPRFGSEVLRHVGEDHNRRPIYRCLACDVYLNREQGDAPLPTSPDGTDWGIYGDSAKEQWNGMEYEAYCMGREWEAHEEDARRTAEADALKLKIIAIHPTESPREVTITDTPWGEIDIAQDWMPSLFYGHWTPALFYGDGTAEGWQLVALDPQGNCIATTLTGGWGGDPAERCRQFIYVVQAWVVAMAAGLEIWSTIATERNRTMTNSQIDQAQSECGGCSDELPGVQTYAAKFTGGGWVLVHYCPECYALARANWNGETEAVTDDPIAIALTRGGEVALLLAGIDEDEHYPATEAVEQIQQAIDSHAGLTAEHLRELLHCQGRVVNLLVPAREVLRWVRECPACEGAGKDPAQPEDACHRCGGYGEEVYGDIMEAALGVRAAVAKEEEGQA